MWKGVEAVTSWLTRSAGARPLAGVVAVFIAVLAIGVLLRADSLEGVLEDRHPIWAPMVKPVAWASLMSSVAGIALLVAARTRAALSPQFKLRCMAEDVEALAESLWNDQHYNRDAQGRQGLPLPCLEVEIAALKGKLESVGVRSPRSSDGEAWRNYLPLLRGWVAAGDLRTARWYQPGRTAIAGWR